MTVKPTPRPRATSSGERSARPTAGPATLAGGLGRRTLEPPMEPPACRLYLITPPAIDDLAGFGRALGEALEGGDVGAVQLRLKDVPDEIVGAAARLCLPMTQAREVPL